MLRTAHGNSVRRLGALIAPGFNTLPEYMRQRGALKRLARYASFLTVCVLMGLIYGLAFAILPPALLVYFMVPVVVLGLFVIWALPSGEVAPTGKLIKLAYIFIVASIVWPDYLAISAGGLPDITVRRILGVTMGIVLLVCLSTSTLFKQRMREVLASYSPASWMLAGLAVLSVLTFFVSTNKFSSFNTLINLQLNWTLIFMVGCFVFTLPGGVERWVRVIIGCTLFTCLIGVLEWHMQRRPWADYAPLIFSIDATKTRAMIPDFRDGQYRVTGPWRVSLGMAEYLACVFPLLLHSLLQSTRTIVKIALAALCVLTVVMTFQTQARLGVMCLVVAIASYACVWGISRWINAPKSDLIGPAATLAFPAAAFVFLLSVFTVDAVRFRTIGGGSSALSDEGRKAQFALMWPKLFRNPFGYGPARAGEVLGFVTPGGQLTVDSYVIALLLDLGVLGFVFYCILFTASASAMFRIAIRHHTGELSVAAPMFAIMITWLVSKTVAAQSDNDPFIFSALAVTAAIIWMARKQEVGRVPS
jgi:hypothetical protein